jgi:beta-galactosidase
MLEWAGVDRPFTSSHDGRVDAAIVIRLHENPEGMLIYILNQGKNPQEVEISLKVYSAGPFHLREIIKGDTILCRNEQGSITWETGIIPDSDVEIWSITAD